MGQYKSDVQRVLDMHSMNPNDRAHAARRMANEERNPREKQQLWDMAKKAEHDRDSD